MNNQWENYKKSWLKVFDFSGRARRSEYWFFVLSNIILYVLFVFVFYVLLGPRASQGVNSLLNIIFGIITIGIGVRRLHDTGKSGWWLLVGFVPILGGLVLLYFFVLDSYPLQNRYGRSPKYGED